jgi:bacterioferritin (cytochrome b1)
VEARLLLQTNKKIEEKPILVDLLAQILKLEYSFMMNYPRLGRMINDNKTSELACSLGKVRATHTDVVIAASHRLGGIPIWNFENIPDNPELVEIFIKQLDKENLMYQLYLKSAELVKDEDLKIEFSAIANEEKTHIKTIEKIIFNLKQGSDKQELNSFLAAMTK